MSSVAKWDERFGEEGFFYGLEPNDFLKETLLELKSTNLPFPKNALALGEGEGRNALFVASLGINVTAVDQSAVGLKKLERVAKERGLQNVTTLQADLQDFDLGEGRWDLIYSIFCHTPSALRKKVHLSSVKALRPGGYFLLEAYNPRQPEFATGGPKEPDMLVTAQSLLSEFKGLEILKAREIERQVVEGRGHTGKAAVVQFLARKIVSLI